MTPARTLAALLAALLPFALTACPSGKEKEPEPLLPSATASVAPAERSVAPAERSVAPAERSVAPAERSTVPVATTAPTAMVIAPEPQEAGADADGAADAQPKTGGPTNLAKCCAAIEQNQNKAPPEQVPLYAGFLSLCKAGIVPPQFRNLAPCK